MDKIMITVVGRIPSNLVYDYFLGDDLHTEQQATEIKSNV